MLALYLETNHQQKLISSSAQTQVNELTHVLNATELAVGDEVKASMNLLKQRGKALGPIRKGANTQLGVITAPNIFFGSSPQANHYELVDGVTEIMGGTATIFVKSDENFVRIATNIETSNGARGIGTILDPEGKVIKALRQGKSFYGVVDILGVPYLTGYEPMRDEHGEIVGAWYVGYKADLNSIKEIVAKSRFLNTGFQAVLDYRGKVRFHSDHLSDSKVEELILKKPGDWQFVYTEIPDWGYKVLTAYPTHEATTFAIHAVLKEFILVTFFLILLLGLIFRQMKRLVYQPIGGDPAVAAKLVNRISSGDLSDDGNKASPGSLMDGLSIMRSSLKSMLQTITKNTKELTLAAGVFEQSHNSIVITDLHGNIINVNPAFTASSGYSPEEVIGKNTSILKSTQQDVIFYKNMWDCINTTGYWSGEIWNRRKNGEEYLESLFIKAVIGEDGQASHYISISSDITERKKADEALHVAAVAFETHEGIMITDANANILRVNQAFQNITGYSAEEVLDKNPRILSSGRHDTAFYAGMWQQLLNTGTWTGEIWDKRKDGQVYLKWMTITAVKNTAGETTQYIAIFNDITEWKRAEEEVRNLAYYDVLTHLPNRRLLLDRLHLALSVSARSHHYGALLFLDLDRFKTINDTLGHDYGDLLLIEAAERIKACVREVDTVARLGGDEFVVLIEELSSNAEEALQKTALIAEKVRTALAASFHINGSELHSSTSIGVGLYYGNEESVDELLKHADMAMYQAKDSGRNTVHFFDPLMQQLVETRALLEADLRRAIPNQQLRLHYQIQMDNDYRPLGAEALVRWICPTRGMVSPAHFIPIAEESSMILDIGYWVLETACLQLAAWNKHEQTHDLTLAINISAQQFRRPDFVEKVMTVVQSHHFEPSRLKLELTESVVLTDVADVVAKMHALRAFGIGLSLDDFGTGYSSLSYLKQLPLNQIKIDQSFVRDITTDPNDAVMVQTIIGMARNFGLDVIAEGVETDAQLAFLRQHGCMAYQGYLFSKPIPIEEFEALVQKLLV